MAKGGFSVDVSGLRRAATRVSDVVKKSEKARKLATASLRRQMAGEAARVISAVQLNLPEAVIRKHLGVRTSSTDGGDHVIVSAANRRLPLLDFRPRIGRNGVTVTTFKSRGPQRLPHAFLHNGKIKQRIPAAGKGKNFDAGPSGLVWRLPLTDRVGPSLARALSPIYRYAADPYAERVREHLRAFSQTVLHNEIQRLLGNR